MNAIDKIILPGVSLLLKLSTVTAVAFSVSACVSSTLGSVDTESRTELAQTGESTRYDVNQRAQAVAEIRNKAAQPGSGVPTNAFADGDGPNDTMAASEQEQLINELQRTADQNSTAVSDTELEQKQQSIRALQQKTKTHYNNAVNTIQN